MNRRLSITTASFAGMALQWLLVWLGLRFLQPYWSFTAVIATEIATTIFTILFWASISKQPHSPQRPIDWVALCGISAVVTFLFAEVDCTGSLHFEEGALVCAELHGGISIAFTLAFGFITVSCLPSALRAWLLEQLNEKVPSPPAA